MTVDLHVREAGTGHPVVLGAVVVVALLHRADDQRGEHASGREKVDAGSAT